MAASAGTNITLNYQDTIDDPDTLESDFSEGDNNENFGNDNFESGEDERANAQSRLKLYATIRSFENFLIFMRFFKFYRAEEYKKNNQPCLICSFLF